MTIGGNAANDVSEDETEDQKGELPQDNQEFAVAELDGSGDSR